MKRRTQICDPLQSYQAQMTRSPQAQKTAESTYHQIKEQVLGMIALGYCNASEFEFDDGTLTIYSSLAFAEWAMLIAQKKITQVSIKKPDTDCSFMAGVFTVKVFNGRQELQRLDEQATAFIAATTITQPTLITPERNIESTEQLLEQLLQQNSGLCFGERHNDKIPKCLLRDLALLGAAGVNYLFLEHFDHHSQQPLLNQYFFSGEMPARLHDYLLYLDNSYGLASRHGFYSLIITAKECNIRIIAIEDNLSYCLTDNLSGQTKRRCRVMNALMAKTIHDTCPADKKWISLSGSRHLGERHHIPGVNQLMGAPAIVISQHNEERIESNINQGADGIIADYHLCFDPAAYQQRRNTDTTTDVASDNETVPTQELDDLPDGMDPPLTSAQTLSHFSTPPESPMDLRRGNTR